MAIYNSSSQWIVCRSWMVQRLPFPDYLICVILLKLTQPYLTLLTKLMITGGEIHLMVRVRNLEFAGYTTQIFIIRRSKPNIQSTRCWRQTCCMRLEKQVPHFSSRSCYFVKLLLATHSNVCKFVYTSSHPFISQTADIPIKLSAAKLLIQWNQKNEKKLGISMYIPSNHPSVYVCTYTSQHIYTNWCTYIHIMYTRYRVHNK